MRPRNANGFGIPTEAALDNVHFTEARFSDLRVTEDAIDVVVENCCLMGNHPANPSSGPLWIEKAILLFSEVACSSRDIAKYNGDGALKPPVLVVDIPEKADSRGSREGLRVDDLDGRMKTPEAVIVSWRIVYKSATIALGRSSSNPFP